MPLPSAANVVQRWTTVKHILGPESRPLCIKGEKLSLAILFFCFQAQEDEKSLCQSDWSADASLDQPSYGSIVLQLKEANIESENSCDFLRKFIDIVQNTSESVNFFLLNVQSLWNVDTNGVAFPFQQRQVPFSLRELFFAGASSFISWRCPVLIA